MNTNEQYLSGPLLWIGISLGVIFAILFYTPFPLSIPLPIAAFILLNFHFRKKLLKEWIQCQVIHQAVTFVLIVEHDIIKLLVQDVVQR